jgi:uncharacterized cupredoxin-like copper-binding protein
MKTKRFTFILAIAFVLAAALTTAACSSQPAGPTVVQVKLTEYTIVMDKTSIPAGPVRFEIENLGTVEHEFVLESAGAQDEPFELNGVASEAEEIKPGAKTTLDWTFEQPGDFQAACYIKEPTDTEDHAAQGMILPFTVTKP